MSEVEVAKVVYIRKPCGDFRLQVVIFLQFAHYCLDFSIGSQMYAVGGQTSEL